jgi:hypothetical protein
MDCRKRGGTYQNIFDVEKERSRPEHFYDVYVDSKVNNKS